ncbi:hypothetical protein LXL04_008523 [Taraxacum kok-saghyz]
MGVSNETKYSSSKTKHVFEPPVPQPEHLADEFRAQVYHDAHWKSDEEEGKSDVKKNIIHDPNTRCDMIEPKLVDCHPSENNDDVDLGDDEGPKDVPIIRRRQHAPMTRKRRPSARIIFKKMKNHVFDKDGGGSSATKPVSSE